MAFLAAIVSLIVGIAIGARSRLAARKVPPQRFVLLRMRGARGDLHFCSASDAAFLVNQGLAEVANPTTPAHRARA